MEVCVFIVFVHLALERLYLTHVRRYCRTHKLSLTGYHHHAWFENGVKTESTYFEIDCLDAEMTQRSIRLLFWVFGVRKVLSIEDSSDTEASKTRC